MHLYIQVSLVVLVYLVAMWYQILPLIQQKATKEIVVVSLIFLMALALSIVLALDIEIPLPDLSL
jgi:hypothetical protein